MKNIVIVHDTSKHGDFPTEQLEKIKGLNITVNVIEGETFKQHVTLGIDDEFDEDIPSLAFHLGMLTQSYIQLNNA